MGFTAPTESTDLPPPPYTPQDVFSSSSPTMTAPAVTSTPTAPSIPPSIRGGYIRPSASRDESTPSAASYFEQRPCILSNPGFYLEHRMIVSPDAAREDLKFPKPEERYRARDVQPADWCTFVNYLLPTHPLATSEKPGNGREGERGPPTELDIPDRRAMIQATITEWNKGFFEPRGIRVYPIFTAQASAYKSTTNLPASHGVSMPTISGQPPQSQGQSPFQWTRSPATQAPAYVERRRSEREEQQSYHQIPSRRHDDGNHTRHRRSLSVSSSSSSSSSSSASSLSSIGSKELENTSLAALRQTLDSFRLSLATTPARSIRPALRQLRSDLRSQRRTLQSSDLKHISRESKAEARAHKRELKAELKSFVREVKAVRKSRRRAQKAERKCRKAERKAERRGRRGYERRNKLEQEAEARALEVEAQNRELELRAEVSAREAEAAAIGMKARARAAAIGMEARAGAAAIEMEARARERKMRGGERAMEAETRGRERGGTWERQDEQEVGVVDRKE